MKIRIITPSRLNAQLWSDALAKSPLRPTVVTVVQPLPMVNVLINGSRPDLVVVEATDKAEFEVFETLAAAHPELQYVLVAAQPDSDMLMRAMRAGVREVLPSPTTPDDVAAAVNRLAKKSAPAELAVERHGRVIGLLSSKGGSGATFVAANLAQMLAAKGQRRVALIDLNLQFGDAALFLTSAKTNSDVTEVARNIQRLDRELLQAAMANVSPGLWVLPAPDDPAHAGDVTPQHVEAILQLACTMFDIVVVDVGRSLSAVTLKALDMCERVYPVLQLTLPFIRDARRLRELFHSLDYPADKIRWVINRHQKSGEITLEDLRKVLSAREFITLPNQYDVVASSVNQGVPVDTLAPASAIARALRQMANDIVPEAAKADRAGWLSGIFKGVQA